MEILPALRAIWRRRWPLAVGLLISVAIVIALDGAKPTTTPAAVAWTSVVLDTPQSQLLAAAPSGAVTLPWRAALLSHLMATTASTQQVAHSLGVRADQISVVDSALGTPLVPTALAEAAATAARPVAPYTLTVFTPSDILPLISIEAAARNASSAARLAAAAVAVLESQASSEGPFSSRIPSNGGDLVRQAFVVEPVAPVRIKLLPTTSLPLKAIGGGIAFFLLWLAVVLLSPALAPLFRARAAAFAR